MTFSDKESAFLRLPSHFYPSKTARFATVSADGQPDVVAVGFEFDGEYLYIGGGNQLKSRKYNNVLAGNTKVALVLDDALEEEPWTPRWLRIYGIADIVEREGWFGPGKYIRIKPAISWGFNLEGRAISPGNREAFSGPGAVTRNVHDAADPVENP